MKPKHVLMTMALLISAWLALFGGKNDDVVRPAVRREPAAAGESRPGEDAKQVTVGEKPSMDGISAAGTTASDTAIAVVVPRARVLVASIEEEPPEPVLFARHSWNPPPPPPVKVEPPPPTAPPLPFVYIGKQRVAHGELEVFLAKGDRVIVTRERAVIDNTYRVESIAPPTMTLVYLPLDQVQQVSVGAAE